MSSSKASTWNVAKLPVALLAWLLFAPATAAAQEGDLAIGIKGGANWSLLDGPADPPGEPTLINGAAFDGWGVLLGASLQTGLGRLSGQPLLLEIDLMYTRHETTGAEEHPETGARREITLRTDGLRLPVLLKWYLPASGQTTYVGLGPELWVGLRSGSELRRKNIDGPRQPLRTRTVTHLLVDALVGYDLPINANVTLPVELRAAWDPFVPATTVGRFAGFQSADNPGRLQIAFDWHVMAIVGLTWEGL